MTSKAGKGGKKKAASGSSDVGVKAVEFEAILQWVQGRLGGTIDAKSIDADNAAHSLEWIAPGVVSDRIDLRGLLGVLEEEILSNARYGETRSAGQALTAARMELDQPQPDPSKVKEKLEKAARVLTKAALKADEAGHLNKNLLRWPIATAGLWQAAVKVMKS